MPLFHVIFTIHNSIERLYPCLPGWEPGQQEGAVEWDEDWDKFEDEGQILFDRSCLTSLLRVLCLF